MNAPKTILIASLLALFVINCKNEVKPEVKTVETSTEVSTTIDPNATYAKAEFKIDGMTCAVGCAATIEKKMAKMDGVKSAKVDFDKKLAMVEYDIAKVSQTNLVETVAKVGDAYTVSDMKTVETFSEQ